MYNRCGDQQDFSLSFLTLLLARSTSCCFSLASVWSCCSCARRSCSSCLRKASSQTFNLSTAELSVLKKGKSRMVTKKKVTVKTSAGNLVRLMFKRAPKVIPDCFGFVCSSLCDWSKKTLHFPLNQSDLPIKLKSISFQSLAFPDCLSYSSLFWLTDVVTFAWCIHT